MLYNHAPPTPSPEQTKLVGVAPEVVKVLDTHGKEFQAVAGLALQFLVNIAANSDTWEPLGDCCIQSVLDNLKVHKDVEVFGEYTVALLRSLAGTIVNIPKLQIVVPAVVSGLEASDAVALRAHAAAIPRFP